MIIHDVFCISRENNEIVCMYKRYKDRRLINTTSYISEENNMLMIFEHKIMQN